MPYLDGLVALKDQRGVHALIDIALLAEAVVGPLEDGRHTVNAALLQVSSHTHAYICNHRVNVHVDARNQVAALDQVHGDVLLRTSLQVYHMRGDFTALLQGLHLLIAVIAALGDQHAQHAVATADVHQIIQTVMRIRHEARAEGSQAQLGHGAVEQDHGGDVVVADVLLDVQHQQQVARLRETVLQAEMVDVVQSGHLHLTAGSLSVQNGSDGGDHTMERFRRELVIERLVQGRVLRLVQVVATMEKMPKAYTKRNCRSRTVR